MKLNKTKFLAPGDRNSREKLIFILEKKWNIFCTFDFIASEIHTCYKNTTYMQYHTVILFKFINFHNLKQTPTGSIFFLRSQSLLFGVPPLLSLLRYFSCLPFPPRPRVTNPCHVSWPKEKSKVLINLLGMITYPPAFHLLPSLLFHSERITAMFSWITWIVSWLFALAFL